MCSRALKTEQALSAWALINSRPSVIWSEEHCDQAWGENKSWSFCLKVIQPDVRKSETCLESSGRVSHESLQEIVL